MQKLNYLHQNPVRAGLVKRATDYRWSSARIWQSCPFEDEPLLMDKELFAGDGRGGGSEGAEPEPGAKPNE